MEYVLAIKIGMLIAVAFIGWGVGKRSSISPKSISTLLIYVISPFVIFVSILESPSGLSYFKFTVGAFITSGFFAAIAYFVGGLFWSCSKRNLFSFSGGTGNTGYFALPIVLSLFEPAQWAVAIFIIIGVNIYEFTLGYFITAKGLFSTRECVKKVLCLPIIYATFLALLCKHMGISINHEILTFMGNFKGAYSILGMMVIGMTLASYKRLKFDWLFTIASLGWKQIFIPFIGVLFFILIGIEHSNLLVISLMLATPMAGNVVVVANQLNVHPEIAAATVMFSTVLSIISIPISLYLIRLI